MLNLRINDLIKMRSIKYLQYQLFQIIMSEMHADIILVTYVRIQMKLLLFILIVDKIDL